MSEKEMNDKKKKQNKTLTIFLTTFIVTFAFVALAVKYFSPEIDVEIGKATEDENYYELLLEEKKKLLAENKQ